MAWTRRWFPSQRWRSDVADYWGDYDPEKVEEEWRTTPTDLGGWANRAAKALVEVKRLRGLLADAQRAYSSAKLGALD